jgi:hypothetical protein
LNFTHKKGGRYHTKFIYYLDLSGCTRVADDESR